VRQVRRLPKLAFLTVLVLALLAATALAAGRSDGSKPAPAWVAKAVANVPVETLNRIGVGAISGRKEFEIVPLGGKGGLGGAQDEKVHVLSYNAAWCPHCAANSWPLAIALSRFGTLGGLRIIDTGTYYEKVLEAKPGYSHTKGISFIDATYSSPLVAFEPVVGYDVEGHKLQKLNGSQAKLVKRFDPHLGFPAVAIDESFGLVGSGYDPGVIEGQGPAAIAKAIRQPSSPVAKAIDGEANVLTAAICQADNFEPEEVCATPGVEKASRRLPKQ
jgi:hypothetical protein